jgi:FixJ family two-component response regulator
MTKEKPLIVIVDDDMSVCRAVRRLIRSAGMDADTFTSGQQFVELLEGRPSREVDCLVLDVQMPEMNGLEVQRRLKTREHPIPIIFITAHDDTDVRDRALAAGAVAFLRKPFNDDLFIRTVQEALKRSAAASP